MGLKVEDARAVLAALEAKLVAATDHGTQLQVERRKLSFDAHNCDAKSKSKLDKLNAAFVTSEVEIQNLISAADEAKARLASAGRFEAQAQARENATAATKLADSIADRGRRADAAFASALVELVGLKADVDALHKLGVTHPRGEQFKVLGGLALMTAVFSLPLKVDRSALAPRERHSFGELGATWRDQIVRWASPFLDKEAA